MHTVNGGRLAADGSVVRVRGASATKAVSDILSMGITSCYTPEAVEELGRHSGDVLGPGVGISARS